MARRTITQPAWPDCPRIPDPGAICGLVLSPLASIGHPAQHTSWLGKYDAWRHAQSLDITEDSGDYRGLFFGSAKCVGFWPSPCETAILIYSRHRTAPTAPAPGVCPHDSSRDAQPRTGSVPVAPTVFAPTSTHSTPAPARN